MAERHQDAHEPDDDEIAARFSELVASIEDHDAGTSADDEKQRADDQDKDRSVPTGPALTYPVAPWVSTGPRSWDGTEQIDAAESLIDEQESFVPPDPGPVLGSDPLVTLGWLCAAGTPIGLLLAVIFWRDAPVVLYQAAGVVFLIGCAVLFWRMPRRRDPRDDDGAVV